MVVGERVRLGMEEGQNVGVEQGVGVAQALTDTV